MRAHKMINQSGFSAIEALLILVILAILGGTGLFVYHAQNNANKTLDTADKTAASQTQAIKKTTSQPKAVQPTDPTTSWLSYTSPGGEFTIKLADGWKLSRYMSSAAVYTFNDADLAPLPGTKAAVTQTDAGKDGSGEGLNIAYSAGSSDTPDAAYKQSSFKTAAGDNVDVYMHQETSDTPMGLGQLDKGGTYYSYVVSKGGKQVVYVTYGFNPAETDYHALVEQSLKTLTVK